MLSSVSSTSARIADARALRTTLARMATSVTLVTTRHDGVDYGFTANSFTSVSSEPPLVAVFLADTADSYGAFARSERVAINILADGHGELARRFATKGTDKFAEFDAHPDHDDLPVLADAMATLLTRVESRVTCGDHLMLLLGVEDVRSSDRLPLVYQDRTFRTLA